MYVRDHSRFDTAYVNIGNSDIIGVRDTYPVKIENYGSLGDYIPFYFGKQSIMLYNILTGYGGLQKQSPRDIIYLCCYVGDIVKVCPKFFFTDGQANKRFTEHFNNLKDLIKVDWEVVTSSDFKQTEEDTDRPRKYQSEFLVHEHVPIECVNKIVVYDESRKESVEQLLKRNGLNIQVRIAKKDFYYFYF